MSKEDQAKELVEKYLPYTPSVNEYYMDHKPDYDIAKKCAIIAIDEKLLTLVQFANKTIGQRDPSFLKMYDDLIEIKKIIETVI